MLKNKQYCVYKHTLKQDGRSYIGLTGQNPPTKRWRNGEGYRDSPKFFNAIQKYGWDNFDHEILYSNLTLEEANQLETQLIIQYNSQRNGFNIDLGGGVRKRSEITKKKISKALKGRKLSEAHIQKLREAQRGEKNPNYGKPRTDATKKKIGQANAIAQLGRKHTEQTKQKQSLAHRNYDKPILCIETNIIYSNLTEAKEAVKNKNAHIGEVCKGQRTTAAGYHWRYLTEEEKEKYLKNGCI